MQINVKYKTGAKSDEKQCRTNARPITTNAKPMRTNTTHSKTIPKQMQNLLTTACLRKPCVFPSSAQQVLCATACLRKWPSSKRVFSYTQLNKSYARMQRREMGVCQTVYFAMLGSGNLMRDCMFENVAFIKACVFLHSA